MPDLSGSSLWNGGLLMTELYGKPDLQFKTHTGHWLRYIYRSTTGEYLCYDSTNDLFLSNREAHMSMWGEVDEENWQELN